MTNVSSVFSSRLIRVFRWLFNDNKLIADLSPAQRSQLDWLRVSAFIAMHIGCVGVIFVGVSPAALVAAFGFYVVRMFFITAFYHRYFSHRAYRVSRVTQFIMAILGCTGGQRGPLWWAGHHREHHAFADTPEDPHSPDHRGMLFSHTLWFLTKGCFVTPEGRVRDWLRFPELRLLERIDWVPFLAFGAFCYWLGERLQGWGTDGPQMFVWGFFVSTVFLYHATYTINSLAHRFGTRRYDTKDTSRNNFWLALLTLGEGWHNNHHRYPASVRQGFFWWELDLSYLILRLLQFTGMVRDIKEVPAHVLTEARRPQV